MPACYSVSDTRFCSGNIAFNGIPTEGSAYEASIMIAVAVSGFAIGTLVLIFAGDGEHPTTKMARCSMGFFVAVVWIMAIADEVVDILKVRSLVFTSPPKLLIEFTNNLSRFLGKSLDFLKLSSG